MLCPDMTLGRHVHFLLQYPLHYERSLVYMYISKCVQVCLNKLYIEIIVSISLNVLLIPVYGIILKHERFLRFLFYQLIIISWTIKYLK